MRARTIKEPPAQFIVTMGGYDFDVFVSFGRSLDEVKKTLAALVDLTDSDTDALTDASKGTLRGRTVMLDDGPLVIAIGEWADEPVHHGWLAHEIFHAVTFLFHRIGMRLSRKSDEAYAYAIDDLTRRIYEELSKPPSKRRTK